MLWMALLLLLLLTVGVEAQSGDTDEDVAGSRISCTSHITVEVNSLTCQLLPARHGDGDDEDDEEEDGIERMTLCSRTHEARQRLTCVEHHGNTLNITDAPVVTFTLTAHLRRGGHVVTTLDLRKIVKPKRPQVRNVTFKQESNEVVVHIRNPYRNDYLTENLMFQLHIWTAATHMVQNLSSNTWMKINMEHLRTNTKYQVEVRALPVKSLEGSWSEWSHTYSFVTPAGRQQTDPHGLLYVLLCLIPLVVIVTVTFLWKKKIFTYEWPSVPRPKDTLVHICKPHKALLLNLNPEVFSALKVTPMPQRRDEPEPSSGPAHGAWSDPPTSTQSSDCRSATSASTEELELSSALLSASSSSGAELSLQSNRPSPVHEPGAEVSEGGAGQQEEAYVTMSSFCQVK